MDDARNGSDLCVACGLCCKGMLHRFAHVGEQEIASLEANGLVILSGSRGATFSLPCVRFEDDRCAIYADRPQACRSYRCQLLKRYLAGEVCLEEGLAIVDKVRVLRDRIHSQTRLGTPGGGLERLSSDANDEICLDAAALHVLVNRHFEARVEPRRIAPC